MSAPRPGSSGGPLVVVGDTLLDVDLEGTATRLTPDAPVPVLDDLVEHPRPGGAGLAALMAARDGHDVVLVTALGEDEAGAHVERLLTDAGVRLLRLTYDGPTPVKRRVRAGGQSLLRLDGGTAPGTYADDTGGAGDGTGPQRAHELSEVLSSARAVLVADYGRGVTGVPSLRAQLTDLARNPRIPLVWDPHPRGSAPVPGARLVTPNTAEAAGYAEAIGCSSSGRLLTSAGAHAAALVGHWRARAVAVTLGARGALLSYGEGAPVVTPAPTVTALDPCGAGDRFAVSAALALGAGRVLTEAVQDAVAAAAAYVGAGGPTSLRDHPSPHDPSPHDPSRHNPSPSRQKVYAGTGGVGAGAPGAAEPGAVELAAAVAARGGTVVATGGCFDLLHAGHVATLQAARSLGDCLVVALNSDASVRRLKGPSRPLVPAADRARVLEALEYVDAVVVFDEDTPVEAIRRIRPHVWAKGGDYAGAVMPEAAVLEQWGGQVVALPYLEGRSTTRLVQTAAVRGGAAGDTLAPVDQGR